MAEMEKYRAPSPDGDFVIPARTKTERHDLAYEAHGAWVGQWIKDRTQVSYETPSPLGLAHLPQEQLHGQECFDLRARVPRP